VHYDRCGREADAFTDVLDRESARRVPDLREEAPDSRSAGLEGCSERRLWLVVGAYDHCGREADAFRDSRDRESARRILDLRGDGVSRFDTFLWVVLPYLCITSFVVGHVWRYRRDQFMWTARSTQLLERRLLMVGSVLFHVGILLAIGGHLLGILVPSSATDAVGISEDAYHWLAVSGGLTASVLVGAGIAVLLYRRLSVPRIAATTLRSDRILYPLLVLTIVMGIAATIETVFDRYGYRETVSPWFRGIFGLDPNGALMIDVPFVFQLHAISAWLLFAIWPFTRLVHVWSVPVAYVGRAPIVYRSRHRQAPRHRADGAPDRAPSGTASRG
jgi:nitrate reductase gamma subunit